MIDWLSFPLSGSAQHHIAPWAGWHARLMVVAWALLLPLGALAARYFKVLPRQRWPHHLDDKSWWHAHLMLQGLGVAALTLGAAIAWGQAGGHSAAARAHAWGGWTLLALGWLQVVHGLTRGSKGGPTDRQLRGDHNDMTPHRVRFERIHKGVGWLAVVVSVGVMLLGLLVADAPRWVVLALVVWWALLGFVAWQLQARGRCIDTYQAIWGPDARHPGNHARPIGWGVRRLSATPATTPGQPG